MRFLGFQLGESHYGVALENVKEVIAFPELTPIPGVPEHCLGIMNLRDQIIPVVDLRIKFRIEPTLTHDTSIIVCGLQDLVVGVVVDVIHSVVAPNDNEVMKVPSGMGGEAGTRDMVTQVVQRDGRLNLTLDMAKVLDANVKDLQALQKQAESKSEASVTELKAA